MMNLFTTEKSKTVLEPLLKPINHELDFLQNRINNLNTLVPMDTNYVLEVLDITRICKQFSKTWFLHDNNPELLIFCEKWLNDNYNLIGKCNCQRIILETEARSLQEKQKKDDLLSKTQKELMVELILSIQNFNK